MSDGHGLGYLPDVPKPDDFDETTPEVAELLAKTRLAPRVAAAAPGAAPAAVAPPPPVADLRAWFSAVETQGDLGSCTANAAAGLLEYFERRASGKYVDASRLFLYKAARDLLGWHGDTGAYLRSAMQAMVLFGAPPERYWPYDVAVYDTDPPPFCYAFASNYKAVKYFRLDPVGLDPAATLAAIKAYLAAGYPSMFGFPVYPEYDNPLPGGLIAYPAGSGFRGGHANVAAGYDDNMVIGGDRGALLVRNSWGPTWGNAGYGWMSYRYVTQGLAVDWWSMVSATWVNTGVFK